MAPLTTWGERSPAATVRASRMLLQAAQQRASSPAASQFSVKCTASGLLLDNVALLTGQIC